MNVEFNKVDNVVVDGIDMKDYPDFCDAYIESCDIDGVAATEKQLDVINDDSSFVYDQVMKYIY